MSQTGEIRRDEACLDYSGGAGVILYPCHGSLGNQQWFYDEHKKLVRHGSSGKCLGINKASTNLTMEQCVEGVPRIQWSLENYNPSKLTKKKRADNF